MANYPSLSRTQNNILTYIEEFTVAKRIPPTTREIQVACEISSTSVVDYNLDILADRGYIQRQKGTARGIFLPATEENGAKIGRLQAAIREALGLISDHQRYNAAANILKKALEE